MVDIALALSFSSQANFTRAFTKATGQAPGQFQGRNGVRSLATAFFGHKNELRAAAEASTGRDDAGNDAVRISDEPPLIALELPL